MHKLASPVHRHEGAHSALTTIYFHGWPGSAAELTLSGVKPPKPIRTFDGLHLDAFDQIATQTQPAVVIGFSLGGYCALRLASLRPQAISRLVLVAPAAPLELGDFSHRMAGRLVFEIARKGRQAFGLFTALQRSLALIAPQALLQTMFRGSCEADQAILNDPASRDLLVTGLRHSFGPNAPIYKEIVTGYVRPWASELRNVSCPCQLFHGALDNWAPLEMSEALAGALPGDARLEVIQQAGHYSALQAALPIIFDSL